MIVIPGRSARELIEMIAYDAAEDYWRRGVPPAQSIAIRTREIPPRELDPLFEDAVTIRTHYIIAYHVLHGGRVASGKPGRLGYKVVHNMFLSQPYLLDKPLRPVTVDAEHWISYEWGKTVKPEVSGPFSLFTDPQKALQWARLFNDAHLHVYLVRYDRSSEKALWRRLAPGESRSQYGRRVRGPGVLELDLSDCTPGTMLADSIELMADLTPAGVGREIPAEILRVLRGRGISKR